MSEHPAAPGAGTERPPAALVVFRLAALFTFLAVVMGSVVCATKSGASCPTWPGCRNEAITPQWRLSPWIEFTHRVVAMASGPLVLAAGILAGRLPRADRWLRVLPWVAVACAIASGAFGRLVVVATLPTWLGGVDLTCALVAMTLTAVAAVRAGARSREADQDADRAGARARAADRPYRVTSATAAASLVTVIAMHVSGIFAAGSGSYTRCLGWPLWRLVDADPHPVLQATRLGLAGLASALVVVTAVRAARTTRLRRWGVALAGLWVLEMVLGTALSANGLDDATATGYSVTACALLWTLGLLSAVAGHAAPAPLDPPAPRDPEERVIDVRGALAGRD